MLEPIPVSIVILAMNERDNIEACLKSCAWCDDIHVLDSGSTDGTVELARELGATVHYNPFKSFGEQRNWAIDNIPAKHDWHFHLDADERFTPELQREILQEIGSDGGLSGKAAYYCPSKTMFFGRWLRYSANYPTYQVRFFHRARCRFSDFGHGQREVTDGEIGTLREPYLHFNFSKGLTEWFAKHNKYSSQEAQEGLQQRQERVSLGQLKSGGVGRRRALKNLAYKMPARPVMRFLYSYVVRGGWRDGVPGLHYCLMMSIYDYLIELKMRELRHETKP